MHIVKYLSVITLFCVCLSIHGQADRQMPLYHVNTQGYAVRSIYCDVNGILWFGTTSGLLTLPQLKSAYPSQYHRTAAGVNMSIRRITGDSKGRLWIKTIYNKNYRYDPSRNFLEEDTPAMLKEKGIQAGRNFTVLTDSTDAHERLWIWEGSRLYWLQKDSPKAGMMAIGEEEHLQNIYPCGKQLTALSEKSLYRISPEKHRIVQTIPLPAGSGTRDHLFVAADDTPLTWASGTLWKHDGRQWDMVFQTGSDITSVVQDGAGRLWIGTQSDGVYIIDNQDKPFLHLQHVAADNRSLMSNHVEALYYEPASSSVWIAYTKGGLSCYSDIIKDLQVNNIADLESRDVQTDVLNFAPMKNGHGMWIGLEERGVWLHDERGDRKVLDGGSAVATHVSQNGELWAGIYRHGLVRRSAGGQMQSYMVGESPFAIAEDNHGNIWAALLGKGVWMLDPESGEASDTHLNPRYVFDLQYHDGRLYAASTEGLYVHDSHHGWELVFDGHFRYLDIDRQGNIWLIGNEGSEGLTLLDNQGRNIPLPADLASTPLRSIAIDEQGNVWTATSLNLLLLRYHPGEAEPIERHSFSVSPQGAQVFYNYHTSFISDGILWLGATTGYQRIDISQLLAKIKEKSPARRMVLGAISINDNIISPGQEIDGRVLMHQDVAYTRQLDLRHNENNIVVECWQPSTADFTADEFYFQLKGLSDAWHPFGEHAIILTNLQPGDYQLLTRTSDSEPYQLLSIHIAKPFWLSWWAVCLYVLLASIIFLGVARHFRQRRTHQLQLQQLQLQQEQQTQMNEMKLRFFTNISHDLRTPLTLIIGPVEEMLKTAGESWRPQLAMVQRNAQHLLVLVNQILDFRRLEFGKEKLLLSYGDIVSTVRDTSESFRLKADKENIKFSFTPSVERVDTMFDRDKTTKIIMNLLSNAFKFTSSGGCITVKLDISDGQIIISVADTGAGIPEADKALIFERFFESGLPQTGTSGGSGIGLHIVKEYVRLQGGEISVSDNTEDGHGSIFRFTIPLKKETKELADSAKPESAASTSNTTATSHEEPLDQKAQSGDAEGWLLLVDDNQELLSYMSQSLREHYKLLSATNGMEALHLLEEKDIDLIVSDVMMPEMDGLELCRRVKSNINSSHIPIILLTAKTMTSDELAGLEAGADDYITKPFSMDILLQRIYKLVERSRQLHERFAKEIDINPSEISVTSLDEQFIARAIETVERHMAEPEFSVEQLSDEMGVHRAQLYKKLQHLTGKSPQQFIRLLRLKRGKQLLEQSGLYVSEVAYKVGFNSPRIFSKYFKEEFGVTPKDFSRKE